MTTDDPKHELEVHLQDKLAAVVRAASSAVPLVGGALGELITRVIPNKRIERIVAYVQGLESRIETLESEHRSKILNEPNNIELIEEGAFQAARATSQERIHKIVHLVKTGIVGDDLANYRARRIAQLLRQLDDDEIATLRAFDELLDPDRTSAFEQLESASGKNKVSATPGDLPDRTRWAPRRRGGYTNFKKREVFYLGVQNLERLGLLDEFKGEEPIPGEHSEKRIYNRTDCFDGRTITPLGRTVLKEIGIPIIDVVGLRMREMGKSPD